MSEAPEVRADDAEASLLGAAMSGADVSDLVDLVTAADFYHPRRGAIWDAIRRVHAAGNRPDPISVRLALQEGGDKHDGIELLDLAQSAPLIGAAPFYAEQVAVAAGHRAISTAGIKLQRLGAALGDLDERREQARQAVDQACAGRNVSRARRLADVLPDVLDIAQSGHGVALGTGWPDVDDLIGGIAPGRLIVVGARPGIGKSLMASNLALHVTRTHGHAVHFASLEMTETEVGQRIVANLASANLSHLSEGRTDDATWERIAAAHETLASLPLTIDDTPGQTVSHIRRACRNVQRVRDDLALVVVDYLQLMTTSGRENRAEALGEISRGLKLLARESGACVVAAAQVNRDATKRGDRPRMSDLRESGAIEADADQVLLLHQPDDELPEVEVIVDKNRHGPKGIRSLHVWGHYARLASTTH